MHIFVVILIGISLSMDAFSLALLYGTLNLKKNYIFKLSLIVSLFHFVMPLLGHFFGKLIFHFFPLNPNFIICVLLIFIGIQMILESFKKEKETKVFRLFEMFLFGFAVSIDSFSVGVGMNAISDHLLLCAGIFSFCSGIFTCLGLELGKKLNQLLGTVAPILGGCVLIILGILYGL